MTRDGKPTGQVIYEAINRGEITREVGEVMLGAHIAKTLHEHPVRSYIAPMPQLEDYIRQRARGMRDRDPQLARNNGVWLEAISRTWTANRQDASLLAWARKNLLKVKPPLAADASRIEARLRELLKNLPPDVGLVRLAREVQAKDVDDRRRSEAG